jgi:hypothetical protein
MPRGCCEKGVGRRVWVSLECALHGQKSVDAEGQLRDDAQGYERRCGFVNLCDLLLT